jgi:hypothetical protein
MTGITGVPYVHEIFHYLSVYLLLIEDIRSYDRLDEELAFLRNSGELLQV